MRLIALEASTEACSAALWMDGQVLVREAVAPRGHAQLLPAMVDALLAEAGLALTGLDAVAVGRGPGAFTGVRIGVALAQGLAYGAGLRTIGVSTLEALAWGGWRETGAVRLVSALDARMGEVYVAAYRASASGLQSVLPECVSAPQRLARLPADDWYGTGSGWITYPEALQQALGVRGWCGERYPLARDVAELASLAIGRGEGCGALDLQPVYLRDEVAVRPAGISAPG